MSESPTAAEMKEARELYRRMLNAGVTSTVLGSFQSTIDHAAAMPEVSRGVDIRNLNTAMRAILEIK